MLSKTALLASLFASAICFSGTAGAQTFQDPGPFSYQQTNLVADTSGTAVTTDPNLIDPWGLAFQPNGAFWVNDKGTGVATLYDGNGTKVQKTFTIPSKAGATGASSPTGLVWNPTQGFAVPGTQLTSVFLFATLQGTLAAWAPNLPSNPTDAVTAVDNSSKGAVYTGLALGVNDHGAFLYAANVNSGKIDVFNSSFQPAQLSGTFSDPRVPAGFVPFGIHEVSGNLVVTYARQNATKTFITPSFGAGFVDIFDTNGQLLDRLASGGALNAPWGVALAPVGFGGVSGRILVGNFGDGHILAFDPARHSVDILLDQNRFPIQLPGLWELHFGGGAISDPTTLYFTEGVASGQHGLLGALTALE